MANAVYPKTKQAWMNGSFTTNLIGADVRAILVDTADYTYNAADDFLADIPVGARVAVSPTLTTISVTDGTFDCDAWTWTAVTGDPSEAIVLYLHTGSDATARLIVYIDTGQTGLPVTPNGGNITFTPNASGVFTL